MFPNIQSISGGDIVMQHLGSSKKAGILTQEAALQQVQSVEAAQFNSGSMPWKMRLDTHTHTMPNLSSF